MGEGIFVSYRRDDSGWVAGRIYERLAAAFGDDRVFFDVLSIDVGLDYMEVIERWIERSEVFLLVMGPGWATIEDERGRRRIEVEDDPHAFEVATALASGKRIIPVLVDGAHMPDRTELPEAIQGLVRRNAYPLSQTSFQIGIQDLVSRIERVLPLATTQPAAPSPPVEPPVPVEPAAAVEAPSPAGGVDPAAEPTEVAPPDASAEDGGADDGLGEVPYVAPALGTERYGGVRWATGLLTPYFVTHHDEGVAVLDDALVLLVADEIEAVATLLPLLEEVLGTGRPLLVVAPDLGGEALATLVVNRIRGVLANAAVKAPWFGAGRRAILHDLAVLTGGIVVSAADGLPLDQARLRHTGSAQRVVMASGETVLIGTGGSADDMAGRATDILRTVDATESEYDREKLRERAVSVLGELAFAHRRAGDLDAAMGALAEQQAVCRRLGDGPALAESLTRQAIVLADRGDRRRVADCLGEAAEIARTADDRRLAEWILGVIDDLKGRVG